MFKKLFVDTIYHDVPDKLDKEFLQREVVAGITTFLTMSYILMVHPHIMKAAGADLYAMTTAVALGGGLATLAMSLFARLPYALAPGMGTNAFFAFTLVASGMMSFEVGMGLVFWAGVAFLLMTVFGLREYVANSIPLSLKYAIGASIGLFIAMLGFKSGHLIQYTKMGSGMTHFTAEPLLTVLGLVFITALKFFKIRGEMIITIILLTLIGIPLGLSHYQGAIFSAPPSIEPIFMRLDFTSVLQVAYIPIIITFFFGDFFSTLGTLLGVSAKAGYLDKSGNLPRINRPFTVDALATICGSFLGLTTVTTYVESSAGVESGGRTPLTSLVVAILFLLSMFIVPLIAMVPAVATAPVLIYIGISLATLLKHIDMDKLEESLPAFITLTFTVFTSSMANGITFGILSHILIYLMIGKGKEISSALYIVSIPLIYYITKI